ncbi:MAG TPA: radical SAM protein [Desulfomonilia bacterium]|nr:radical SAM protein [Desulfomonilia bacterium]
MPDLVFADCSGNIMEFPGLAMIGRSGDYLLPVSCEETIPLPGGAQLYVLPGRYPIGLDRQTGEIVVLTENPYDGSYPVYAVATFLPAAHTQTYLAAWERSEEACELPLYAYTALGWDDGFVTTAVRTDSSRRQDPDMFDHEKMRQGMAQWKAEFSHNRLVEHLSHCALAYGCPAALNLFQGREEAPLPTSPGCNASCVGCISKQPCGRPPSPQERIGFIPSPEEIAEVALKHITTVREPVVSFGQGCEGEPLMASGTIREAIVLIRKMTSAGTINLNTNASLPYKVAKLADVGLDSMRISMNSPRRKTYEAYFRPSYDFDELARSALEMKRRGRFVSVNLFVFPGLTDAPLEVEALKNFIESTGIDMIQWRNLNMDPDSYLEKIGQKLPAGIGIKRLIESIPLRRGYFNPFLGRV